MRHRTSSQEQRRRQPPKMRRHGDIACVQTRNFVNSLHAGYGIWRNKQSIFPTMTFLKHQVMHFNEKKCNQKSTPLQQRFLITILCVQNFTVLLIVCSSIATDRQSSNYRKSSNCPPPPLEKTPNLELQIVNKPPLE